MSDISTLDFTGFSLEWLVTFAPNIAFAEVPQPPQWYEVVAGIIAIPVALIGLVYSWFLIQKTRIEARKLELDVREKQKKIEELAPAALETVRQMTEPLVEVRKTQYLLVRFVVLYVVLALWDLFQGAFNALVSAIWLALDQAGLVDESLMIPLFALQQLPQIGRWVVLIAIGWPLLRDTSSVLGVSLRDFFRWTPRHKSNGGA
jgi:hypothetical protein